MSIVTGTLLDYWGKEKGLAYYRKLAENDPVIRQRRKIFRRRFYPPEMFRWLRFSTDSSRWL